MLVLQPRISTAIDGAAVQVGGGLGGPVGGSGVSVGVGGGISVPVTVTAAICVIPGGKGDKIIGVAVTIFGVREGGTIQVAAGWGAVKNESHALRKKTRANRAGIFFMFRLYSRPRRKITPQTFPPAARRKAQPTNRRLARRWSGRRVFRY